MIPIAVRHYEVTLAYRTHTRERRMKNFHRSLRIILSKRRFKQRIRTIFYARTLE